MHKKFKIMNNCIKNTINYKVRLMVNHHWLCHNHTIFCKDIVILRKQHEVVI